MKDIREETKYPKQTTSLGLSTDILNIMDILNTRFFDPPYVTISMEEYIDKHRVLDIYCKDGNFLVAAYHKFMGALRQRIPDREQRSIFILKYLLYGAGGSFKIIDGMMKGKQSKNRITIEGKYSVRIEDLQLIRENLYGDKHILGNIHRYVEELVTYNEKSGKYEGKNGMKFSLVVGNPPYNDGIDLDFINLAYEISDEYVLMINPAKWQTAADDYQGCASKNIDYTSFRKKIVPHMSCVCFYPCCKDVFDILEVDGITYFLLDKTKTFKECTVINKCKYIKEFNGTIKRDISNRSTLINIGNEIIEYLGDYNKFKFGYAYGKRYQVWTNKQVPGGGLSTVVKPRKTQFLGISEILDTNIKKSASSGTCNLTFEADTEQECINFVSWLNTKFTRFFVAVNISKLTGILTDDCFRFVPAPPSGKFDHIYTDQELYRAFNLPQKYIDVIEAVVKERK